MRKSKAEIFRQGVGRNDILREPCSIFFSSMVAFGKSLEQVDQRKIDENMEYGVIQSMGNVVQNLNLYNVKTHIKDEPKKEGDIPSSPTKGLKMSDLPLLSSVKQDVTQGYLNDVYTAIHNNENPQEEKDRISCILPRSTIEYEKSSSVKKIKAIRGLSPKKDISISLPQGSESLLVSKVYCDSRF